MTTWLQFRAYLITTLRNAHVSDLLLRDGSSSRTFCSAASNLDRWHCSEGPRGQYPQCKSLDLHEWVCTAPRVMVFESIEREREKEPSAELPQEPGRVMKN